ncbi:DUF7848 domain-containing protein [Streptomyces yaizuensis]
MTTAHENGVFDSPAPAVGPALLQGESAPTARVLRCTRCAAAPPVPALDAFARWALDHTVDHPGHLDYRQVDSDPRIPAPMSGTPAAV